MRWLLFCLLMFLAGCGYHLVNETRLPGGLSKVKIDTVINKTTEPFLDSRLQRALARYLALQPGLKLVRKADAAEAVVEAVIFSYQRRSLAYNLDDRVAQYRIIVDVEARLRRRDGGMVLWQEKLAESQEYQADDDLEVRENREEKAVLAITAKLAETIVARMQAVF